MVTVKGPTVVLSWVVTEFSGIHVVEGNVCVIVTVMAVVFEMFVQLLVFVLGVAFGVVMVVDRSMVVVFESVFWAVN